MDGWPYHRERFNAKALDTFVNLRSLHMTPLSPEICDFIIRSPVQLVMFTTKVDLEPEILTETLIRTLSAASLQTVENFHFMMDMYSLMARQDPIVNAITGLRCIQRIKLEMGLDLKWCQRFASLADLKELVWIVRYADKAFRSSITQAEVAFQEAFVHFEERPQMQIELVYSEEYWARMAFVENQTENEMNFHLDDN
jgi:hypothetical protein